MQRCVNDLVGFSISAINGHLGKVSQFFFDDQTWSIRYLVVETGNWLSNRQVLIPHSALESIDWNLKTCIVNLTTEQVRNSPNIETEKTVARQHEIELLNHYGLPVYWSNGFYTETISTVSMPLNITKVDEKSGYGKYHNDPHLRSTKLIKGYHIHANDGDIGHVEDYLIDDEKWNIRSLIVDTNNWLPGRKVLIMPRFISRIDWEEQKVFVNLSKESIENSPKFNSSQPFDNEYEIELINHYGDNSTLHH